MYKYGLCTERTKIFIMAVVRNVSKGTHPSSIYSIWDILSTFTFVCSVTKRMLFNREIGITAVNNKCEL